MTRLTGATELFSLSFISVCLPFHFITAIILYTHISHRNNTLNNISALQALLLG